MGGVFFAGKTAVRKKLSFACRRWVTFQPCAYKVPDFNFKSTKFIITMKKLFVMSAIVLGTVAFSACDSKKETEGTSTEGTEMSTDTATMMSTDTATMMSTDTTNMMSTDTAK